MDPKYWHQRWRENDIPFHEGRVNGYLEQHFSRLRCNEGDRVFVPLCGKAVDIKWICEQGCDVLGVELSPVAIGDFYEESGIEYRSTREGAFEAFTGGGATLLCGDLFDMTPAHFEGIDASYDRAAYIAFDTPMRARYADFMCDMLPPGTPVLLLTLEYPPELMDGPPFAVGETEVRERFGARYDIEHLDTRDIISRSPYFQKKGLPTLLAHAFLLRDRPGRG